MKQSVSHGCKLVLLVCLMHSVSAGVVDNTVYTERAERISSGNELISSILNNCYDMDCLKGNVLNYLNSFLGNAGEPEARSAQSVDEQIFNRVARLLKTNEFKFELPETFFRKSIVTFNGERGFDVKVSEEAVSEARKHKDDDIKKKLLLPALLLLKLKLKAILPLITTIIGIKAFKALVMSKLALTLVVGFIAYSLLKKPAAAAPAVETSSPAAPASSYDPSSWEPSAASGGPYARVWDPSAQNLAYSAYYSGASSAGGSGSAAASATSKPYSTV